MPSITLLLVNGFADWEYAYLAGTGGPYYGVDVRFVSPTPGQITSQGGLAAIVPDGLDTLTSNPPDALVVIGSALWTDPAAPDIAKHLTAQNAANGIVGGICGGTLPLARAGLLNTATHTSNDADFLTQNVPGYTGQHLYRDTPVAHANARIVTAPGIAPVTFTAEILTQIGIPADSTAQLRAMMAAEHQHPSP